MTVKSAAGDYASLSAAEAGENGNLVTLDRELLIECHAMSDTTAVTFAGWTVDATRFVRVEAASGAGFDGTFTTTGRYTLSVSTNVIQALAVANGSAFTLKMKGIQIDRTGGSSVNYRVVVANATANNGVEFDSCFLRVSTASAPTNVYVTETDAATNTLKARNSAFVGGVQRVVLCNNGTLTLNNCVVNGGGGASVIGVARVAGTCTVRNSAVFNCNDDFNGTITVTYCASDDGDGTNAVNISPGATEATDWAAAFTDYANHDYTVLGTSSVLYNAGNDLSADATYPVTVDAGGTARPQSTSFDIGVDELVSGGGGGGVTQRLIGGNLINRSILRGRLAA